MSSRLYRGDFPSIENLIPPVFPFSVEVETSEFLSASDRVKIISSAEDRRSQVELMINKDNEVVLSARSTNYGNSVEKLKNAIATIPSEYEVFDIGFNIDYVIDAVKALKSDKVKLVFSSPTRMFMAKNDNPDNIQIVTPIRLPSY